MLNNPREIRLRFYTLLLRFSAFLLAYSATWVTRRYLYEVQLSDQAIARRCIERGDLRRAKRYPGGSWYDRLGLQDYRSVRAALLAGTHVHPKAAVEAMADLLRDEYAAEEYAPLLAAAGFVRRQADDSGFPLST